MFIPRTLANTLDQIARQTVGKDWNLYAALLEHWREIVGKEYAEVTTPVKVTFPHQPNEARRKDGTLTVRLPKGLSMEFSFKTEQIRQRVNSYFGYNALAKIVFDPVYSLPTKPAAPKEADPAALKAVKEMAQSVGDDDLQAALESLGSAILTSTPRP